MSGYALPLTVAGFVHAVSLSSGVKDASGMWVAKCHPLDGGVVGMAEAEKMAHLFAAAPELLAFVHAMAASHDVPDWIRRTANDLRAMARGES